MSLAVSVMCKDQLHSFFRSVKIAQRTFTQNLEYVPTYVEKKGNGNVDFSKTFEHWIIQFFRNNKKYATYSNAHHIPIVTNLEIEQTVTSQLHKDGKSLRRLSKTELLTLMLSANISNKNVSTVMKIFDHEWRQRLQHETCLTEILIVIDAWFTITSNRIAQLHFYEVAIDRIEKLISFKTNPNLLLQSLFYTSLRKNNRQGMRIVNFGLKSLDNNNVLNQFTIEELSIFASSVFRTSTEIRSHNILKIISSVVIANIDSLLLRPELFTSLIKPLRHAQYYEPELMDNIAVAIQSSRGKPILGLQAKVHLLAFYSGALFANLNLLSFLIYSTLEDFQNAMNAKNIRIKDVDKFLWALSNIGLQESMDDCFNKARGLMERFYTLFISQGVLEKHSENIVNIILWQWILNWCPEDLVKPVSLMKTMCLIKEKKRIKNAARTSLLLTCLSVEAPYLVTPDLLSTRDYTMQPTLEVHLDRRPALRRVWHAVSCLAHGLHLQGVSCGFQIPCLYIGGITANWTGGQIHIEVLDKTVCLSRTSFPHGLMQLKLRLLKKSGDRILLIDSRAVDVSQILLFIYLEEQLAMELGANGTSGTSTIQ